MKYRGVLLSPLKSVEKATLPITIKSQFIDLTKPTPRTKIYLLLLQQLLPICKSGTNRGTGRSTLFHVRDGYRTRFTCVPSIDSPCMTQPTLSHTLTHGTCHMQAFTIRTLEHHFQAPKQAPIHTCYSLSLSLTKSIT